MAAVSNHRTDIHQVPLLTERQIAKFKRDGLLVLPGALDPDLCRQTRDQMWEVITERRPAMKRNDPSTWLPFTKGEAERFPRSQDGGDPYFFGSGHRLYIRNGAEDLLLNTAVRPVWNVAEQLLGKGEVVWPAGVDQSGNTVGPCLLTEGIRNGMKSHLGTEIDRWVGPPTGRPEQLRLPRTGPVWSTAQGARGLYCTLPDSPPPTDDYRSAHSEAMYDTYWRLQVAAYIDDLPPKSGGLTLWPGSHRRIWDYWNKVHDDNPPPDVPEGTQKWDGYNAPPLAEIKSDTEPVETYGPAGSVVLWHANLLHTAGQNTRNDVIRQAAIYAFAKTPESVPAAVVKRDPEGDLWRDWSTEVKSVETAM